MRARFEPIVGRYMHLDLFGRPHRIYVEEAGEGTPLLCLHTAGADGRQYRELMNDPRVTARHRVIAFDMPWHGKSSPPAGWHDEEYQLTSAHYVEMTLTVINKEQSRDAAIQVVNRSPLRRAEAMRLTAPSLTATTDVQLGGAAVGADGLWKPLDKEQIIIADGVASLNVPAGSAVLLSLAA